MATLQLVRFFDPAQGNRVGVQIGDSVHDVTAQVPSVAAFLKQSLGRVSQAIGDLEAVANSAVKRYAVAQFNAEPDDDVPHWLPPCDIQEVWAAGVTYERSRAARQEESQDGGDIYARVYNAERPELFFKSQGAKVVPPFGYVGIRRDATWNVPEPELVLVLNPRMEVVGFTVGNDMSSRDIEGENPLYLPQAKVYKASCALGPGILLAPSDEWPQMTIKLTIARSGQDVFSGEITTARIKRGIKELTGYLGLSSEFENGVMLLTGTGIVPPSDFTLRAGDVTTIAIDGIGSLTNTVMVV
ncbi:MAG: fumarylacetoacetate hydrolase family protein [Chloroflexi bacterium]|nr:fumarylacetoacetate hydrolase family protein [Chloroflexota bacterium]MCC6896614.1 fumarylacetoacetate hydrolase family protein [Anaerolineae bacterium]